MSVQKGLRHPLGDGEVEVIAAEEGIAGRREHLEHVAGKVEQRAVECAAAEVVDSDALLDGTTQTVGQRGSGGLVDDAEDVETGDAPGHFGRRALQLVEVCRDRDDCAVDRLAERRLGDAPSPLEDERADLGEGVLLAAGDHERPLAGPFFELEGKALARPCDLVTGPCAPE